MKQDLASSLSVFSKYQKAIPKASLQLIFRFTEHLTIRMDSMSCNLKSIPIRKIPRKQKITRHWRQGLCLSYIREPSDKPIPQKLQSLANPKKHISAQTSLPNIFHPTSPYRIHPRGSKHKGRGRGRFHRLIKLSRQKNRMYSIYIWHERGETARQSSRHRGSRKLLGRKNREELDFLRGERREPEAVICLGDFSTRVGENRGKKRLEDFFFQRCDVVSGCVFFGVDRWNEDFWLIREGIIPNGRTRLIVSSVSIFNPF